MLISRVPHFPAAYSSRGSHVPSPAHFGCSCRGSTSLHQSLQHAQHAGPMSLNPAPAACSSYGRGTDLLLFFSCTDPKEKAREDKESHNCDFFQCVDPPHQNRLAFFSMHGPHRSKTNRLFWQWAEPTAAKGTEVQTGFFCNGQSRPQ